MLLASAGVYSERMDYSPPVSLLDRGVRTPWEGFLFVERFLERDEACSLLNHCRESVEWRTELVTMFGQTHVAPRLVSCYGDPGNMYRYRGSAQQPLPWTGPLGSLRNRLVSETGAPFNFVLMNRYRDGNDYVGFHSDDERDLAPQPVIASLSLGSTRRFRVRKRTTGESRHFDASHGSLILMWGDSQSQYKHALIKTSRPVGERFNLSYRLVTN